MSEDKKRTYTAPILLIIIVLMSIVFVLIYSKLLLAQQAEKTEAGMRLAEKYSDSLVYADRLQKGAEQYLNAASEVDRLQAKVKLGEAQFASRELEGLLVEAIRASTGQSREQVIEAIASSIAAINGSSSKLYVIGEHEGGLTEEERATLTIVRDGAAQVYEALRGFRPPSGEAGYRQMHAGGAWIDAALEAHKRIVELAGQLR